MNGRLAIAARATTSARPEAVWALLEDVDRADGTEVEWRASFDRTLGGRMMRGILQRIYGEVLDRLVAAAEAAHD